MKLPKILLIATLGCSCSQKAGELNIFAAAGARDEEVAKYR